jgi:hypothetical protein
VSLAEAVNGPISRPVEFAWPVGTVLSLTAVDAGEQTAGS